VDVDQAEKELSEVNLQLESLHERLDEADGLSSAQVPIATRSSVVIIVIIVITVVFHKDYWRPFPPIIFDFPFTHSY